MDTTSIAAFAVFSGLVLLAFALLALPFMLSYLYHRRRMAELKGTHAQHVETLQERMERLEKKCAAMQEQITDAHMLLADEQRMLDKKLAESFPGIVAPMPPIPDEPSVAPSARRKNRERLRE